jgi:hypothetical protein
MHRRSKPTCERPRLRPIASKECRPHQEAFDVEQAMAKILHGLRGQF